MKYIATLLLLGMAALFLFSKTMLAEKSYVGYVTAFAEAGMIGAIADWFAVVALFRRPLGLPIPHTAIIPANRDRIAERLADFLCLQFLNTEQIAKFLGIGDPVKVASRWLLQPTNARKLAASICRGIEHILPLFENERLTHFIRDKALEGLAQIDLANASKELLHILVRENQHQIFLEKGILQTGKLLADETVREQIAAAVASEVKYLKYIGLDAAAGRYATRTMVSTIAHLMEEMADDPEHPFRKRFEEYLLQLLDELENDESRKEKLRTFQQHLIQNPQLAQAFSSVWQQTLEWIREDSKSPYSKTCNYLEQGLQNIGRTLKNDAQTRQWMNEKIFTIIPQWISRNQRMIHRYIVNTVKAWSPEEMGDALEQYIGRDLQYIRINGTLVGGLVGLIIHATSQFL